MGTIHTLHVDPPVFVALSKDDRRVLHRRCAEGIPENRLFPMKGDRHEGYYVNCGMCRDKLWDDAREEHTALVCTDVHGPFGLLPIALLHNTGLCFDPDKIIDTIEWEFNYQLTDGRHYICHGCNDRL